MNEEQYRRLCDGCDQVLQAPDSTMERIAIPWLHIVREHPVFLAAYEDLFQPGKSAVVGSAPAWLRRRAGWLKQALRPLYSDGQPWVGPGTLPKKVDFLFVSHLLNDSQAGQPEDFYFGRVANELTTRDRSAVIALINHTGRNPGPMVARWEGSVVPRVVFSDSLQPAGERHLRSGLQKESARLREQSRGERAEFQRRVWVRASEEAVSGRAIVALRMALQVGDLVRRLNPRVIVVTHEGHSWERVTFAAARKTSKDVLCVGYQHAALFRFQHAVRRRLGPPYDPDRILTAGDVTQAQLAQEAALRGIPVTVLGSGRGSAGQPAGSDGQLRKHEGSLPDGPACLVIPEGIASECDILFNFSLSCARKFPMIRFVWRLHPVISFEALAAKNHHLRDLPINIEMSRMSMEQDLKRCRWALYRGSTAIVQAVLSGLRPIYLKRIDELSIDPLYELGPFRVAVASPGDLEGVIRVDLQEDGNTRLQDFKASYDYCRKMFVPWNVDALDRLVAD